MKVIYVDYLPEEITKEFKIEQNVYVNEEDGSLYLVTDNKFNELQAKYNLTNLEEDGDKCVYVYNSLEAWIDTEYEQDEYSFMGENFLYNSVSEIVSQVLEEMTDNTQNEITFIECDNWIDEVKSYIISSLSDTIKRSLEESLESAKKDGVDIGVLKMAFSNL